MPSWWHTKVTLLVRVLSALPSLLDGSYWISHVKSQTLFASCNYGFQPSFSFFWWGHWPGYPPTWLVSIKVLWTFLLSTRWAILLLSLQVLDIQGIWGVASSPTWLCRQASAVSTVSPIMRWPFTLWPQYSSWKHVYLETICSQIVRWAPF